MAAKRNMAKQEFLNQGGESAASSVRPNKYPTKAQEEFADFPSVRDSQAVIQSQMREYQQNHVIAKKGRHAGNLPLKPSKADLVES